MEGSDEEEDEEEESETDHEEFVNEANTKVRHLSPFFTCRLCGGTVHESKLHLHVKWCDTRFKYERLHEASRRFSCA